jgi:hypothetical protein
MDLDIFEPAEALNINNLKLKSHIPFSAYN